MRAYIGPYIYRWTTKRLDDAWERLRGRDPIKYDNDFQPDAWDNRYEKLSDGLQWVLNHTINVYKDKQKRRVKIKIHGYDAWSADSTLAMIILPILLKLKENKHGSPDVDDADVPEHLRRTAAPAVEYEWDTDDNWHLRWDWVLDEMIYAFEQINDPDWEDKFSTGEMDLVWEPIEGGKYHEMKHGPNHTYVTDYDALKAENNRIRHGTTLFGKYFRNLWD